MSVQEAGIGFAWLLSVLLNDSQLSEIAPGGVWRSLAPPGIATPYVLMSYQSGVDEVTLNGIRILDTMVYQVKAVGPSSKTAIIESAAARIDELIGKPPNSGTTTGGYIAASWRESPLVIDELVAGELWTNLGGLYRLLIEQT